MKSKILAGMVSVSFVWVGAAHAELQWTKKGIQEKSSTPQYEIRAAYPQIGLGVGGEVRSQINAALRRRMDAVVAQFKKEVADGQVERGSIPPGLRTTMSVDYSLPPTLDGLQGVLWTVDTFFAGAAHPNLDYVTLNMDLRTGKRIDFLDIFEPGSSYLSRLSTLCAAALQRQLGNDANSDMIREGTRPQARNFQDIILGRNGLEIYFAPYRVAPYAVGPQTVVIPYRQLQDVLTHRVLGKN